jgi:CheY-like chemotaxis protein
MTRKKVIICDDEEDIREIILSFLEDEGYSIRLAKNGQECVDLIEQDPPDLVCMDVQMPVMDGFRALNAIRLNHPPSEIAVVMLTAFVNKALLKKAVELQITDYCTKPPVMTELQKRLRLAMPTKYNYEEVTEILECCNIADYDLLRQPGVQENACGQSTAPYSVEFKEKKLVVLVDGQSPKEAVGSEAQERALTVKILVKSVGRWNSHWPWEQEHIEKAEQERNKNNPAEKGVISNRIEPEIDSDVQNILDMCK